MLRALVFVLAFGVTGCTATGYAIGKSISMHTDLTDVLPAHVGEQVVVYHRDGDLLAKGELDQCTDNDHVCVVESRGSDFPATKGSDGTAFLKRNIGRVESADTYAVVGAAIGSLADIALIVTAISAAIASYKPTFTFQQQSTNWFGGSFNR